MNQLGANADTDGMAIAALVLAIIGLLGCFPLAILALVLGYKARSRIAASNGLIGGAGLASAAVIIGWVGLALLIPVVVVFGISVIPLF